MPSVVRYQDICTGHGSFEPRKNIQASSNVFVNGLGVHRKTDRWDYHCNSNGCHDGAMAQGSSNVFVNGLNVARVGDSVDCSSKAAQGSSNVFCND